MKAKRIKQPGIVAVAYYRMSSDRQDKSIDGQRAEVQQYAQAHGYELTREYLDEGISGDKTDKRLGFQQMVADASTGAFAAIVVWDQDRFGRFDSIEAGHWIHPLRQAGVQLVTVNNGPINWNDFAGRLIYNVTQEGKHQFLRDLSRNVVRGQMKMAREGRRNSKPPYGYDRMLVDERGEHRTRLRDGERAAKPQGWRTIFVPGDAEKVEAVRWMFRKYAEGGVNMRDLARELNDRGLPTSTGKVWTMNIVRKILGNEMYCGRSVWGRHSRARYHQPLDGDIQPVRGKPTAANDESCIVVDDAHEPLVDRKLFAAVQARLVENKKLSGPTKADFLFKGLIRCGHCGAPMHGWTRKIGGKNGRRAYTYPIYICSTYQRDSRRSACRGYKVNAPELTALVVAKLREHVFEGGDRERLREKIRQRLEAQAKGGTLDVDRLRKKLADLNREIDQAADRFLKAPAEVAELLLPKLSAMKAERDKAKAALESANRSRRADRSIEAQTDAALAKLEAVLTDLESIDTHGRGHELVRRLVSRVQLWFERVDVGRRTEYHCTLGLIEPASGLLGMTSDVVTTGATCSEAAKALRAAGAADVAVACLARAEGHV